jgi:hypothetical protein
MKIQRSGVATNRSINAWRAMKEIGFASTTALSIYHALQKSEMPPAMWLDMLSEAKLC